MTINNRLRAARRREMLSLRQMEKLTATCGYKVSRSTLYRAENGRQKLDTAQLAAVCRALRLDANWVLFGEEK